MTFDLEGIFVLAVFAVCNLFLGSQIVRLFWPLHRRLRSKFLTEFLAPQSDDAPAVAARLSASSCTDQAARAAVPLGLTVRELQFGTLSDEDMRLRRFWWRAWIYVIAAILLFYTGPSFLPEAGTPEGLASVSTAMLLMQALCAYSQGLLVRSIADFRERLIVRWLDRVEAQSEEREEVKEGRDAESAESVGDSAAKRPEDEDSGR